MTDAAPSHPPLLAARGLAFSRNDEPVFGPLEFAVDAGEALLVQGGNGVGKTTLLRVLAGLLRADAGQIDIDGQPAGPSRRAHAMAYLSHLPALKADLSALENLNFLCGLHGRRARQMPGNALAMVGLAGYEDALARQLSAGQKKRLSLARLWLSPSPLWLLDDWTLQLLGEQPDAIGSLLLDIVNGFLQLFSTVVLFRCFMLCSQQPTEDSHSR